MNGYNMKTIEERADRAIYEPTDGHPLKTCEVVAFARGYELGATEQKAINDELCAGLWVKIDAGHPLPYGQEVIGTTKSGLRKTLIHQEQESVFFPILDLSQPSGLMTRIVIPLVPKKVMIIR